MGGKGDANIRDRIAAASAFFISPSNLVRLTIDHLKDAEILFAIRKLDLRHYQQ